MTPPATVVVRAKDEAAGIGRVLELLAAQEHPDGPPHVVVVDSGSTDGTVAIARAAGVQLVEIPAASFTFGGALNRGCEEALAPVVVALSAHAFPPDPGWLVRLLAPFEDPRVAAVAGTDRDPDGAPLGERVLQDLALARQHPRWGFSNAAGAFRTELWRARPFRTDMPGCEDKEWARHWLAAGRLVAIDPAVLVEHDHSKDGVRESFRRARVEWHGLGMYEQLPRWSAAAAARTWWGDDEGYASRARARLSHRRVARLAGRWAGQRAGARS